MTPKQIIQARNAIQELSAIVLPYKAAREAAALKRRLEKEFETIVSMERALIAELGGKPERGGIQFPDDGAAAEYAERWEAILNEEAPARFPSVDLSPYMNMIRISPGAVDALEELVVFEREAQ